MSSFICSDFCMNFIEVYKKLRENTEKMSALNIVE